MAAAFYFVYKPPELLLELRGVSAVTVLLAGRLNILQCMTCPKGNIYLFSLRIV